MKMNCRFRIQKEEDKLNGIYIKQNDLSNEISALRKSGRLEEAIQKCKEAVKAYPSNNFFYKILGDIYAQQGKWEEAADAYLENIKRLEKQPKHFRGFVRFYELFQKKAPEEIVTRYNEKISIALKQNEIPSTVVKYITLFLAEKIVPDDEVKVFLLKTDNDKNYPEVRRTVEKWQKNNNPALKTVIAYRIHSTDHTKSKRIDRYIISVLEKEKDYRQALQLIQDSQKPYDNLSIICSALRMCRRINDYSFAENELTIDENFIIRSDFNIQYELVYYYQEKNDAANLQKVLKVMRGSGRQSIPISRTLYNFYLSFNMFDEAEQVYEYVQILEKTKKSSHVSKHLNDRKMEEIESEQVVWQRLKDLVSEQEHNRQMIALNELLKGFSHELGQPITNIRYAVQLHKMKMDKGKATYDELKELLENVLNQTERIGYLLARFRPIVSSKSKKELFSIKKCVESVFLDLDNRLQSNNVKYSVFGSYDIKIYGDPVQFSQVFYNLILNSMQAMDNGGIIQIKISGNRKETKIRFWDNGPGIPVENARKIFEPFFSTKDPSDENGGEGLGLFIVWNILKMFDGIIHLDEHYNKGAKFVIILPYRKENNNESSSNS